MYCMDMGNGITRRYTDQTYRHLREKQRNWKPITVRNSLLDMIGVMALKMLQKQQQSLCLYVLLMLQRKSLGYRRSSIYMLERCQKYPTVRATPEMQNYHLFSSPKHSCICIAVGLGVLMRSRTNMDKNVCTTTAVNLEWQARLHICDRFQDNIFS